MWTLLFIALLFCHVLSMLYCLVVGKSCPRRQNMLYVSRANELSFDHGYVGHEGDHSCEHSLNELHEGHLGVVKMKSGQKFL